MCGCLGVCTVYACMLVCSGYPCVGACVCVCVCVCMCMCIGIVIVHIVAVRQLNGNVKAAYAWSGTTLLL